MEKVGNLIINYDKLLTNDKLLSLKGGNPISCTCTLLWNDDTQTQIQGNCDYPTCDQCAQALYQYYVYQGVKGVWCNGQV